MPPVPESPHHIHDFPPCDCEEDNGGGAGVGGGSKNSSLIQHDDEEDQDEDSEFRICKVINFCFVWNILAVGWQHILSVLGHFAADAIFYAE